MRNATLLLAAMLCGLFVSNSQAQKADSSKQTYKWVDEKGVIHYGDHVPSEYSQREQRVLNSQGVEVQQRQAEMPPDKAAEYAARQKVEAERKRHDMFLISTYSTVKEIESVRDVRLDQIGGQISAAEAYIGTLGTRIDGIKQRAMMFAPYSPNPNARRLPDNLAEEMVRALSELRTQNSALLAKRTEHQSVVELFDTDIKRFRELRMSAQARMNEANSPKRQ